MPNWLDEENERAEKNLNEGKLQNSEAMVLSKPKTLKPKRKTHGIYTQISIWKEFQKLVNDQKLETDGKNGAPELAEEALLDLLAKYGRPYDPEE
ncbi:hypothetical protein [Vibrio coralliilyticus]|uniref:hypothetical protein n=1 Tax=Vibrio coralliilyticus TaxID=190893 RepID=UPI000C16A67B|nr:hypothetical protein [Vibrio coralliilyticus]